MTGRRSQHAVRRDGGCTHANRGWVIGGWRCMACDEFVVRWPKGWITMTEAAALATGSAGPVEGETEP